MDRNKTLWRAGLALGLLAMASCASTPPKQQGAQASGQKASSQQAQAAKQIKTDPADVQENLNSYMDRNIQVEGRVARVIGPNAFVVEGGNQRLLVVSKNLTQQSPNVPPLPLVRKGDDVTLNGRITQLTITNALRVYSQQEQPLAGIQSEDQVPAIEVAPTGVKVG